MPSKPDSTSHIDMSDRAVRESWMTKFAVTEERLRKAVRMVGSRISTVSDYLGVSKS